MTPHPSASPGPNTYLVIPVHNRRETTLRCLRHLRESGVLSWATPLVVDSGSTDGTATAIRTEFPTVPVLAATSDLWWTGATVLGMKEGMGRGADFIFWLNDDTLPEPGALEFLQQESMARGGIVGGVCFLPCEDTPAYSGQRREFWHLGPGLNPGAATIACDALNGNLVCLPAAVIRSLGYPDEHRLPHVLADFDYTLRAVRAGIPVHLAGRARAHGQPNLSPSYRSWLLSDVPILHRWRQLAERGSHLNLRARLSFFWRHFRFAGVTYCLSQVGRLAVITVIRAVVPLTVLRRWHGHRSATWQHEQRHRPPGTGESAP